MCDIQCQWQGPRNAKSQAEMFTGDMLDTSAVLAQQHGTIGMAVCLFETDEKK